MHTLQQTPSNECIAMLGRCARPRPKSSAAFVFVTEGGDSVMPATVDVEGMEASPEELEDAGWTAAFRSRKRDVGNGSSGGGGQRGEV
ncbi:hypothetical protein HPB50_028885 [Hyalomma asiaticum]|nr:hypothetical protein HPB50_028885 [Hyalomma asiaticum]